MDLTHLYSNAFENFSSQFQPNELAYLALTSKPEGQIRDAIAYYMYQNLSSEEYGCAREWHRADLALLKDQKPLLLCEFKCAYSFDCVDNNNVGVGYGISLIKDLSKSIVYAEESTSIYACLFLVHPKDKALAQYHGGIKYADKINRSLRQYSEKKIIAMAQTNIYNYFKQWGITTAISIIDIGKAYGVGVSLLSFVVGPFNKHDVASILDKKWNNLRFRQE